MVLNTTAVQVLNPNAPMAWFPPSLAKKLTVHLYTAVGSMSILLWDIIVHLPEDYELLTTHRINLPFIAYCISRLSSLAYSLGLVIVQTTPAKCEYLRLVKWIYVVAFPSTVLLFIFRVCALYNNNRYVVAFFSLSWLSVLASSIALSRGVQAMPIEDTGYCVEIKSNASAALAAVTPFVHDTIVFIASSYAFMSNHYGEESKVKNGFKAMVLGKYLPAFSKSILRDGQAYYLVTLVVGLFFVMFYYIRSPLVTPCTFGVPIVVLVNNMTCYVYRNMRLSFHRTQRELTGSSSR